MDGSSLPENGYADATLWLRPGHAVYTGPSLRLDPHSGSVACLAVGLDGSFTVHRDGHPEVLARSALIAPRVRHRLVAAGERMLFCYLDPSSTRRPACEWRMTGGDAGVRVHHRDEAELVARAEAGGDLGAWLDLAAPMSSTAGDPRISDAAAVLRKQAHRMVSAGELAAACGLSTSRFRHLFRDETGTSFRRYRLWARMLTAADLIAGGSDLTTAATEAGFATPSHFSDAFHGMFGLPPSRLLGGRVTFACGPGHS
ncbi:AraC family transcriptional regulator [Amycolatopsis minnesotensis]|uniref:helix-turn-helix domain-containing protein n=1 Tax=Amycolatopsis minnesotensis TaxID=337894 RepID=UPI0031DAD09A